ncbi:MAG: S24 family peptidase [Patescibacteria group bacterium]
MKATQQQKVISFYRAHKRMPNITEAMAVLGLKSRSAAFYAVNKLVAAGIVSKDAKGKLVPASGMHSLPLLGSIRAGFAAPAEEALADTITVGDYLVRNKESSYLLQVQGDSMIDAGIHEGDMVIFERTSDYNIGDIVVALTEDGYTLKYLRKKGGRYCLEPANAAYPIIVPREGEIIGVVTGTFRKYK